MKVALYYPLTEGGVSRRISEIQTRSKYKVKIIRDTNELEGFDIVHSYNSQGFLFIHNRHANE